MSFKYDILDRDDFRILHLLPSKHVTTAIHITLETTNLRLHPRYQAVSYTWSDAQGSSELCEIVNCDNTQMKVTANCQAVLQRLRDETHTRVLWIDAICINQQSRLERSRQVSLMRLIYTKATKVIIYLGAASDELAPIDGTPVSCLFQDYLGRMAKDPGLALYEDLIHAVALHVQHSTVSPLVKGFLDVTRRRWWNRVWVIQEAVSAKRAVVVCGDKVSEYADFAEFFSLLARDGTRNAGLTWSTLGGFKDHLMARAEIVKQVEEGDVRQALQVVLVNSQRLEATDPMDHINGFYGVLASISSDNELPPPDYDMDKSSFFKKVNMKLFASLGPSFVLSQVARVVDDTCLPSWCGDWSKRPQHHVPSSDEYYHATRDSKAAYSFSDDGEELHIKGVVVDSVHELPKVDVPAYRYPYSSSKAISGYRQSCLVGMSIDNNTSNADKTEVLWRTMCWDVDGSYGCPAAAELADHFTDFHRLVTSDKPTEDIEQDLLTHAAPFNDIAVHSMPLCVTSNGLLGSVPPTTEVDDQIALVTGCRVPLVLRKLPNGNHRLVGICYVHELMNGREFYQKEKLLTNIQIQ